MEETRFFTIKYQIKNRSRYITKTGFHNKLEDQFAFPGSHSTYHVAHFNTVIM